MGVIVGFCRDRDGTDITFLRPFGFDIVQQLGGLAVMTYVYLVEWISICDILRNAKPIFVIIHELHSQVDAIVFYECAFREARPFFNEAVSSRPRLFCPFWKQVFLFGSGGSH